MKTLMTSFSDLEVDQIIEKVLINNHQQPYNYSRHHPNQLTSEQHIWHYKLQEENQDLKDKLKELKLKFKKKSETLKRQNNLEQQIEDLKRQLEEVLLQNGQLQKDINRFRLRNEQINDSIRMSIDQSRKRSKSKKSCLCDSSKPNKSSPKKEGGGEGGGDHSKGVTIQHSPPKQILKTTRQVSINCHNQLTYFSSQDLKQRRNRINNLNKLITNQQTLINSFEQQLNLKQVFDKKNTRPSTSRLLINGQPTVNTLKPPSSAGSIVKIRRT